MGDVPPQRPEARWSRKPSQAAPAPFCRLSRQALQETSHDLGARGLEDASHFVSECIEAQMRRSCEAPGPEHRMPPSALEA
jgi:hypothetical protein